MSFPPLNWISLLSDPRSAIAQNCLRLSPEVPVIEAIAQMSQLRQAPAANCVVVERAGRLVGLWTEHNLVDLCARQCSLEGLVMKQVMVSPVVTLRLSELSEPLDIVAIARLLQQHQIHHLPILNDQGGLVGLVTHESLLTAALLSSPSSLLEMSDRHRQAVQLQDLSDRLTLALKAGAIGTWDWDLVHEAIWDQPMYELYGLQHLDRPATYQDWRERVHPEDIDRVEALLQGAVEGKYSFDTEFRIRRADGADRWIRAKAVVQRNQQGTAQRMIGINQDITERKQQEIALQISENRFRRVFSANIVGMIFTDFSGRVYDANDRFLVMLGYSREELDNNQINWAKITPAEHIANDLKAMENLRHCQAIDPWEKEYIHKDGSRIPVLIGVALFTEADTSCVCVVMDISDRKQTERQLQHSNAELVRATRLKDEFLANMSHELRTPLNSILGMTEGLQEAIFGPINEQQIHALQTIERSSNHLLSLINDILDVAKIESGQIELHYSPVSISRLCESSLAFVKQQAQKKHLQLTIQLSPHLPELLVDERRIRQVLINLLTNAVKFTPNGGQITLEASLTPEPQGMGNLCIAVSDTGIGISADNIPKLFQPFIQVDSALNRQHEGTGLGLALVKRLVELHGGSINVRSEVGVGSCFTVALPLSALASPPPQSDAATIVSSSQQESLNPSPLILLAEDNEANITTTAAYLEAKGYRLLLARDGQAAIALARSAHPDLILMDIQMPATDGLEAIRQIRQIPTLATVPIIALTALAMTGDRERCLTAGASDYLSKPVEFKQLTALIQQLLQQ